MKKFLAILLIFLISVPQTFAAISFEGAKLESTQLRGTEQSADMAVQTLFTRATLGASVVVVFGTMVGKVNPNQSFQLLTGLFLLKSVSSFALQNAVVQGKNQTSDLMPVSNYAAKSRDVSRISKLNTLALSLLMYQAEYGKLPNEAPNGCLPYQDIISTTPYLRTNGDYVDPKSTHENDGCASAGEFAYRKLKVNGEEVFMLSATMEDFDNGNSIFSIDQLVNDQKLLQNIGKVSGKYYIYISE